MHCYINKVLTTLLPQEGANSSASCQDRGGKQARQPLVISESSCLSLNLPLSVKTLGVSGHGHGLSDGDLRTSAINAQ